MENLPNADFSKRAHPATVAGLMVWLASVAGKDVNGAVIPVRGKLVRISPKKSVVFDETILVRAISETCGHIAAWRRTIGHCSA